MKKTIVLFSCLVFFSLACLSTSAAGNVDQSAAVRTSPTLTSRRAIAGPEFVKIPISESGSMRCAVVIADTALHLREAGNVHAPSITHLKAGDVVEVEGVEDPLWWYVSFEGFTGYARAAYLEEMECVK